MGLSLPPLLLPHPPTPSLTPHSFLAAGKTGELPKSADGSYGTSITLSKALDRASDVILAYKQNGRLLTPDHGYPLRIIIPGYVGGRMVKWLEEVCVSAEESQNHYHFFDNRVLPSHVDEALANAEGELARRAALHGVWWAAWWAAWRACLPAAGLVHAAYLGLWGWLPCPTGGPACQHHAPASCAQAGSRSQTTSSTTSTSRASSATQPTTRWCPSQQAPTRSRATPSQVGGWVMEGGGRECVWPC